MHFSVAEQLLLVKENNSRKQLVSVFHPTSFPLHALWICFLSLYIMRNLHQNMRTEMCFGTSGRWKILNLPGSMEGILAYKHHHKQIIKNLNICIPSLYMERNGCLLTRSETLYNGIKVLLPSNLGWLLICTKQP